MNYKKIISVLISFLIISTNIPFNVFADDSIFNKIKEIIPSIDQQKDFENNKLILGELKQNNGLTTFPNANATFDGNAGLKMEYLDSGADVTTEYEVNGKKVSSKNKVIITEEYNSATVNAILKSLKITSDKKIDIKVSLVKNNSNYMPLGTVATANKSYLNETPDKAIDANIETDWSASDYKGQLNLKFKKFTNINKVHLKVGVSPTAKNTYIIKSNGMVIGQKTLIVEQSNLTTVDIDVDSGNYNEIEIECKSEGVEGSYSPNGSWISINEILLSSLSEELDSKTCTIDNVIKKDNELNLGEIQRNGSIVTFPNADISVMDKASLKIKYSKESNENIITEYEIDGEKIISEDDEIITLEYDTSTLKNILKTLKINTNNSTVKVEINLVTLKKKYMLPIGTIASGAYSPPNLPANAIDGKTQTYWSPNDFNGDFTLNFKEATYVNNVRMQVASKFEGFGNSNTYKIWGYDKDGIAQLIGKGTYCLPIIGAMYQIEQNVKENYYNRIKIECSSATNTGIPIKNVQLNEVSVNTIIDNTIIKSDVVTIEKDKAPNLTIPGNMSIQEGSRIDLMEGVSSLDDCDGDLTSKITYKITNPNSEIVDSLDLNVLGKWVIEYKVEDTNGNISTKERVIKVVKDLSCYSVEFGKPLRTSTFVEFPNSKIIKYGEIDKKINGIKLYFTEGFNDSISIHYTDKGIKKTSREQQILLDSVYTKEEAEALIKSIRIEHNNSSDFFFNVRLSNSDAEDIVYNYENGHYYKFIDAPAITWKDAKKEAEKQEFLGHKGNLIVIKSEQEQAVVNSLTKKNTWLGATDEEVEGNWVDVKGKQLKWTNWATGEPNNLGGLEHYLMMLSSSGGKWNDTINECGIIEGFLVEYGGDSPLPTPDTLDDFNYNAVIKIKKLVATQDISLKAVKDKKENKVILDWNDIRDISYYKVYQKKEVGGDFKIISDINLKGSYLDDKSALDDKAPTDLTYKTYQSGIKQGIKFDSEDEGSTYEYYVDGISKYGDITNTSNKQKIEIKSGLKGYSYEVSNNSIPSLTLGGNINSEDGFISAKELVDKSYIHIVSIDKVGNKSKVTTLPILGLFINSPPLLNVGGDISIKQGEEYDLMAGVSAIDDYDGNLTKDIKVIIKNPSGKIVEKLDTNILGKWNIEYGVKDSKDQETKVIRNITITENLDYLNIKLGEPNRNRFNVTFPNAIVTNSKDTTINGMKFYITNGYNSDMIINYEEKGIKKSVKTQQILLKDKYTTEEANNIVKSIKIEHNNSNNFDFSVRLQSNLAEDMVYNSNRDCYYKFVEANSISWKDAKKEAEKQEFKGIRGHLATIKSSSDLEVFNSLTSKRVWLGATDEEKEGVWKWVTGELVTWSNWDTGEPNNLGGLEHYLLTLPGTNGKWNDVPLEYNVDGYIIEFKVDNKPKLIKEAKLSYEDTVHIEKMTAKQDLVLNATDGDKYNEINLMWNDMKDEGYYKVYRRTIGEPNFEVLIDKTKENNIESGLGDDKNPPEIEFSLVLNKEMTAKLQFYSEDIASGYEYKVESYDADNYITAYSNIAKANITSAMWGYNYVLDENPNTEADGEVNNTDGKFEFKNVTDKTYLHISAIDTKGNRTKTKHIRLSDTSHNNKPIINTSGENKVISVDEDFDKLKDIRAYDLEDGDLTSKIKVEGEIDNKKIGVYELKYTVEDSKGLKAEEVVKIHVKGNMKIEIEELTDKLNINWNSVNNAVKYKLYKTDMDGYSFDELGVFNMDVLSYEDSNAIDISSPIITYVGEQEAEDLKGKEKIANISNNIMKYVLKSLKIEEKENMLNLKAKDLGSTYRYFVEALDNDDNVINSSEVSNGKVTVGLAGFSYVIDDEKDTKVPNIINAKSSEDIDISKSESKILHIKAIDLNGNASKTINYLIGGKYDTNFIPIINGLDTIRVHEGNTKIDLMKGVSAYDYEDGDLTKKIKIKNKIDVYKNGRQTIIYTVEDSHGNVREAKRQVLVDGDMEIKVTPNVENNNMEISWDENVLGDEVYYEVRKYDEEVNTYKTIGYTENLNFIDEDAKDIYGPRIYGVYGSDMDSDELEDEITLNINGKDRGVSLKYQVRTRLKEDNLIIRDMTDKDGRDWGIGGAFSGDIEYYKWKLSDKREDTLEEGMLSTTITTNEIKFNHEGYKYIHFVPYDTFGNVGQVVHYQIGKPSINGEEDGGDEGSGNTGETIKLTPPTIEGVEDKTISLEDRFKVLDDVIAKDYNNEDLTDYIKVEGRVNRYQLGEYKLTYSVMDFKGQLTEKVRTIKVVEYNKDIPEYIPDKIKNGPNVYFREEDYIHLGDKYNENKILSDIKVLDYEDGDITNKITYETDLDVDTVGSYQINYTVKDSDDNVVRFTRTVYVYEGGVEIPSLPNEDNNTDNEEEIKDTNWTELRVHDEYINTGSEFDPRRNIYAYDAHDGHIEDKVKVNGFVNTLKEGSYSLTYKVTNSNKYTTVRKATVYVKNGEWSNENGEMPNPDPDWGGNDDENSTEDNIPNKPHPPQQDEDDFKPDKKPSIDNDINNDGQDDIYIDKNGNVVKPDGSIEIPGGIIVKPSEDGIPPSVDEEGNIIVPPNGIIVKPDGSTEIPKNGAIIRPDGSIEIQISDESKDNNDIIDDSLEEEVVVSDGSKDENIVISDKKTESPSTGDKGMIGLVGAFTIGLIGLILNNKKRNKK